MTHLALRIAYDGTAFAGYQRQAADRTVQATLEEAIGRISGEPPEAIRLSAAGRTDAGVHAEGQVVDFTTASRLPASRWVPALNAVLPEDVAVIAAREVPEGFHSRFSAVARAYRYQVLLRPTPDPLRRTTHWQVGRPLPRLAEALALWPDLVGTADFAAFGSTGSSPRSSIVTVTAATATREGEELTLSIAARSFLYHMVRRLVGATFEVATGRLEPAAFRAALAGSPPPRSMPTAPPHGLILADVVYPPESSFEPATDGIFEEMNR